MANQISNVNFLNPHAAEMMEIERKRALAGVLQQQSMEPIQQQQGGRFAVPISPFQGLAKMGQAYAGALANKGAMEGARDLSTKAQNDYRAMVAKGLRELQGSPAQTIQPDPQEAQQSADYGTPSVGPANVPAQAPDPTAAMGTFGSNPMGAPLMPLAMQQYQRQALLAQLRGGQPQGQPTAPQGNPMQPGGGSAMPQGGGQPQGPQNPVGGPAWGIPMEMWLQIDPTGKAYFAALAKEAEKGALNFQNLGGQTVGLDPYTGQQRGQPIQHTLTPAEQARIPMEQGRYTFETGQQPPIPQAPPGPQIPQAGAQPQAVPQNAGPQPLPPGVPESDRAAYEQVLNASKAGKFATVKGLTPGLTPKQQAEIDAKRAGEAPQARQQIDLQLQDLDRLTSVAKEIANHPGLGGATGIVGAFPSVPGRPAANAEALISSLKAQISAMKLQAMRNASRTGGAVGQVTEKEWPRLENMIVAFDPVKMGKEASQAKLLELVREIDKVKKSINEAYATEYGGAAQDNDPLGLFK